MPADTDGKRLLREIHRTAPEARADGERLTADEGAMWSAHERALVRARDAGAAAQRIASTAARQRGTIDAVAEQARSLRARVTELQAGSGRMCDAFERLGLVALNAGLEGARLGESEGRQLAIVGEEVRAQSARGGDTGRELSDHLAQLATELSALESQVAQAQTVVTEVTQDSARAAGAASDAEAALLDVAERVKKATGSDPEAVRGIAEASERARALASSLNALSGKVPRALLASALRPAVEPLARLLSADEPDEGVSQG
jgi:methyl-accepting chemotaxis protein